MEIQLNASKLSLELNFIIQNARYLLAYSNPICLIFLSFIGHMTCCLFILGIFSTAGFYGWSFSLAPNSRDA